MGYFKKRLTEAFEFDSDEPLPDDDEYDEFGDGSAAIILSAVQGLVPIVPTTDTDDVRLMASDGRDLCDEILSELSEYIDGFEIITPGSPDRFSVAFPPPHLAIFTTDLDHHTGGPVVYYNGRNWERKFWSQSTGLTDIDF